MLTLALVAMAVVALAIVWVAARTPSTPISPSMHVTDNAGMLEATTRTRLEQQLQLHLESTGHHVLVWIDRKVPTGVSLEEFCLRTFNKWGVGRRGVDDGVVLFLFSDDREIRLEVGKGLVTRLNGLERARIINSIMKPKLRAGRADEAVGAAVGVILSVVGDPR